MERIKDMDKIFEFINHMPKSVRRELPYYPIQILKNISMLPESIAEGDIYKIYLQGKLEEDGYEKSLLYLVRGSILKDYNRTDKESYIKLKGVMTVDDEVSFSTICKDTKSHVIGSPAEDTVVLAYKYM